MNAAGVSKLLTHSGVTGQVIWAIILFLTVYCVAILLRRILYLLKSFFQLKQFEKGWNVLIEKDMLQNINKNDEYSFYLPQKGLTANLVKRMVLLSQRHSSFDYDFFFDNSVSQYTDKLLWVRWILSIQLVLGLLGTVLGLREAINALYLVGNETREVLESMIKNTMSGMGTAFNTTIGGIFGMLVISFFLNGYQAIRKIFLNKLDLFLHDNVAPFLFPNPQQVLVESYRMMTEEFTKTQTAIKESNTGFIESLQNVSKDMMESYKSTFDDFKNQFDALNVTTANLALEHVENYEKTQTMLETINSISTEFHDGMSGFKTIHELIADNYRGLSEKQESIEKIHEKQIHSLRTHTEQLSETLRSNKTVNVKLTDLNDSILRTLGGIQTLSNTIKNDKENTMNLQKELFSDLAVKREEEFNKLTQLSDQNINAAQQMNMKMSETLEGIRTFSDLSKNDKQQMVELQKSLYSNLSKMRDEELNKQRLFIDQVVNKIQLMGENLEKHFNTYQTFIQILQSQHQENHQKLIKQGEINKETTYQGQKDVLDEFKKELAVVHEALKCLDNTLASVHQADLEQWIHKNQKQNAELLEKFVNEMANTQKQITMELVAHLNRESRRIQLATDTRYKSRKRPEKNKTGFLRRLFSKRKK